MNKRLSGFVLTTVIASNLFVLPVLAQKTEVITKDKDVTIVNTESLTKDVKGFKDTTPVKIYIKNNKILKVEALPNKETPNFFSRTKSLFTAWDGLSVSKAAKLKPDAVSGATFSSKAVIKNVQTGLQYYQKHKK